MTLYKRNFFIAGILCISNTEDPAISYQKLSDPLHSPGAKLYSHFLSHLKINIMYQIASKVFRRKNMIYPKVHLKKTTGK